MAHQGGWDELVMVAVPLILFAAVLFLANRRAGKLASAAADDTVSNDTVSNDNT